MGLNPPKLPQFAPAEVIPTGESCKIHETYTTMIKLAKIPNLTELTYRSIKQNLLDGTLGELSRLTAEPLATQLGLSKSPAREPLNPLEPQGPLCLQPRRAPHARQLSPQAT